MLNSPNGLQAIASIHPRRNDKKFERLVPGGQRKQQHAHKVINGVQTVFNAELLLAGST